MDQKYRLFIAIELPAEARSALHAARRQLESGSKLPVRWANPEGAHLTLKFLGEVAEERVETIVQALEAVARSHHPFSLQTTTVGAFPSARAPRVLWLGVGGDVAQLHALQADVERYVAPLGFPTEQRPFSPHLTLARTDKGASGQALVTIGTALGNVRSPAPVTWRVSGAVLMRSELLRAGPRYTALSRVILDTPHATVIIAPADEQDTSLGR